LGDAELALGLLHRGIEANSDAARDRLRIRRGTDAAMARIQLADHEIHHALRFTRGPRARYQRLELLLGRFPVPAVVLLVEEMVALVGVRLCEDLHLLPLEINVHLSSQSDRFRLARIDSNVDDAALLDEVDLLAARCKLRVRFPARRRRELARYR